jgi:hypothetical protein
VPCESATCSVPYRRSSCSSQASNSSSQHVGATDAAHTRGQTTLTCLQSPTSPCPQFLGLADDREMVL